MTRDSLSATKAQRTADAAQQGKREMSKLLASLGGNTGAFIAGGGMVVALGLGAYVGFGGMNQIEGDNAEPVALVDTPATTSQETPAKPAPDGQSAEPTVEAQAPSFDELRREEDGTTIIAGRAEPLSEVKIIVDGAEVATATADGSGGFAAITVLPPKDTAQIVSLSSESGEEGGDVTASLDEIILAPSQPLETGVDEPVQTETATVEDTAPSQPADAVEAPTDLASDETAEQPQAPVETAKVAVLKSDEEGVTLLNPEPPQAMTAVALDTIGYSEIGDVQLSGRAQPDTARVRVYLDNRSVISLPVDASGRWRGDLPDVDEGVYTLRVDEVSTEGAVSSRVETPFKRESAAVLAQANEAEGPIKSITVQTGATLWAIARDRYGDGTLYLRVVEANSASIRDPDLIYPGQVFDLPN
ncbi:LysM domain protein [Sulfitobacter donghicola DSW-25 = KCTC 12864 = JCM 14565]|uniref:Peptidoglycan-binding protein LysM n=2 Tax=Sulfitobacter TaxID=60136 RepID=A0A073IIE6_9RHOB|nr:peptidoglycan-binding protein LysM [Sulfitobacter donghicola DSW-25 = KCTC 12864 = JCM 14565]KIN66756.1 LysM domain protein [Sulfitobacter donghicola DSW-25 = KCTC 12864 = JCM 14565]